jgi:hypothetical protein
MAEKESVWKCLPIVFGLAIGWMIFNPPGFLRELGAASYLVMILFGLIALIVFCGFIIHANLPKDVVIRRSTTAAIPGEMTKLSEDFKALGFSQGERDSVNCECCAACIGYPFCKREGADLRICI